MNDFAKAAELLKGGQTALSPFEAAAEELKRRQAGSVGMALTYDTRDPDAAAKSLSVGKALGVSPFLVDAEPEAYDARLKMQKAAEALRNAPKTAAWLSDMGNGVLAKDDLDNLTWFERNTGPVGRALGRGARRIPLIEEQGSADTNARVLADVGKTFDDIYKEEVARFGNNPPYVVQADARRAAQLRFDLASNLNADDIKRIVKSGSEALMKAKERTDAIASVPMSQPATRFRDEVLAGADNSLMGMISAFASDPLGGAAFVGETAAEFVPALIAASAVTTATRSPGAGAIVMGMASGLTENSTSAMEMLNEMGVKLETADDAVAVLQNAEIMKAARDRGLSRGLVIGMMDAISGGVAGKTLAKSPVGDMIAQGIAQIGFGAGGEAAGQVVAGQQVSWKDIVIEGLAELATAPLEVLGVGGRRLLKGTVDAETAGKTGEMLSEVDTQAMASKLRERAPEKFKEALDAQDLGDQMVYVPADALKEYFQAKDTTFDAETAAAWGIDPIAFEEAAQSGNDVAIPMSNYATYIAGTDTAQWFAENATSDPNEMSAATAKAFNESVQTVMQEAFYEAERARLDMEELRAADVQIYDQVFSQLRAAGRSPDVARSEASVWAAFWRTMGERYGDDPLSLARQMGVDIRGPQSPEFRRRDNLDIMLNTLRTKGVPKARGQSLAEFVKAKGGVQDVGGDVASLEPPKGVVAESAEEIRMRKSQPTLEGLPAEGRGVDPEDMARMAVEAGYFPDLMAAVANGQMEGITDRLVEALRDDLSGRKVYAEGEGPDVDLQALADALSERGIDIATATNDEIAAAMEADDGQTYNQDGSLKTDTPAFQEWFGNSKVVDADGKPLVVYHGTRTDFEVFNVAKQGAHFGTGEQAKMRNGKTVVEAYLAIKNLRRVKDAVGNWEKVVKSAKAAGFDGLVYLNRYEGVPLERFEELRARGISDERMDKMPDAKFRKLVPEARDSFVAFRPEQIKSVNNRGTFDPNDPRILYQDNLRQRYERALSYASGGKDVAKIKLTPDRIAKAKRYLQGKENSFGMGEAEIAEMREALKKPTTQMKQASVFAETAARMGEKVRFKMPDGPRGSLYVRVGDRGTIRFSDHAQPTDFVDGKRQVTGGFSSTLGRRHMPATLSVDPKSGVALEDALAWLAGDRILYQPGKRGKITLPSGGLESGRTVIDLFESADLSSFIHESGHFFLEAFSTLAAKPDAPQAMKDDMAAILEWFGVKDWSKVGVKQHEQWARGFEAYALEGRAPSLALADALSRFKAWLTRIYKSALGLNVKITPEIREVMDRMLATDAEIAEARAAQSMSPLFAEAPPGMSEGDFATYRRMARRATERAEQTLLEKTMAKVRREKEAWYKAEKRAAYAEVAAEFDRRPEYRLIDMLANQTWIGAEPGVEIPDMQIDRKMLVDQFGEGVIPELARTTFGGKRAIYGENGVSPEEAAQFFGFGSAAEMIAVLQNTAKKRDAVAAETERRMVERHGDPLHDGSIEEEALAAIHSEQQANTSIAEARHLASRLGRSTAGMTAKLYRQRARAMIGRMSVRDAMRPERFLASERKAARAAQDAFARVAKGTGKAQEALAAALQAKEQQILNGFLYDEARKVAEYVQKGREKMRDYGKKSVREKLEGGYIEQIDAILDGYDFRVRGQKQIARAESLKAFIDRMIAEGREGDLHIDDRLMDEANRKHYTRLSVDELRGLFDTVANIDHLGRFKQKLIDAKRKRDLDAVATEIGDSVTANISGQPPARIETASEARHKLFRDYLNTVLNADTVLREMDGWEDLGPAWSNIKQGIDEGRARLEVRRAEAVKAWDKIYSAYSSPEIKDMTTKRHIPELGASMSKFDLISVAVNTGNETNFERLTNPRTPGHFTRNDLEAVLGKHLDERDWRTVQNIWDYVNSFWPEIVAKEKRHTGVSPKKVEAKPMIVGAPAFVTGGYFPIDYDGRLSGLATDYQQKDLAESLMGGRFGKAQTDNGHTKSRVKSTGQTLRIDIGIGHRHVDEVLYDLEMGEAVSNAWQILQHPKVKDALIAKGRQSDFDALEMWLLDVASGDGSMARGFEKVLRGVRSGFVISRLAWNIGTMLLQPLGIAQSFVAVGKKAMLRGMTEYMRHPARWRKDILAASPLMQKRWISFERDVHNQLGEVQTGPMRGYEQFYNKLLMPSFFVGMMKIQFYSVDIPTWIGAYLKQLDKSGDEAKARAYADLMVRRAQGSGFQSDLGMLQRGSTWGGRKQELPKLFTSLAGYMFATLNVGYESAAKTNFKSPAAVLALTTDLILLVTLPAVLEAALRGGLPDGDDDEKEILAWLAKETALGAMATLPGLRELGGATQGFSGGGALGSSMEIAARFLHQLGQGEVDKAAVKSTIDVIGITLGLPSSQTNRLIEGILDDDLSMRSDPNYLRVLGIGGGREKSLADMIFGAQ